MKSFSVLLALAVLATGMTGCIAQTQHDDLRTLYRKSQERVVDLEQQIESLNAEIAALKASPQGVDGDVAAKLAAAEAEVARLRRELAELSAGPGDLPLELASALQALADQYPGLMTFDPDRKMIQMTSDLTFALGSTKVKPEAAASLAKLAQILNSADASQFEVRVVGHTDNVPVTNPANRTKYEDNWGLSAFRAKSVMQVLKQNGVSQGRMSIAGYGEQQPVVANPARGGAQANRRVEIFLVPPYRPGSAPAADVRPVQPIQPDTEPAQTAPDESPAQFK